MLPFRAWTGGICCWKCFFAVLDNWSGCCFCFPSSIHFSQRHRSAWACVRQQKEGEEKLSRSAERDRLPSAQMWPSDWWPRAASSLSQWPRRRQRWSQEGQWTVRTERTGWRTSRASIPSRADINTHCNSGTSICLSVRGRMEARTVSLDWLSLWSAVTEVKNFGCFCLFPLAPRSLEKMRFHSNWWGTFA